MTKKTETTVFTLIMLSTYVILGVFMYKLNIEKLWVAILLSVVYFAILTSALFLLFKVDEHYHDKKHNKERLKKEEEKEKDFYNLVKQFETEDTPYYKARDLANKKMVLDNLNDLRKDYAKTIKDKKERIKEIEQDIEHYEKLLEDL